MTPIASVAMSRLVTDYMALAPLPAGTGLRRRHLLLSAQGAARLLLAGLVGGQRSGGLLTGRAAGRLRRGRRGARAIIPVHNPRASIADMRRRLSGARQSGSTALPATSTSISTGITTSGAARTGASRSARSGSSTPARRCATDARPAPRIATGMPASCCILRWHSATPSPGCRKAGPARRWRRLRIGATSARSARSSAMARGWRSWQAKGEGGDSAMAAVIRKIVVILDETRREMGRDLPRPIRRAVACAVIENPFAGRFHRGPRRTDRPGRGIGRAAGRPGPGRARHPRASRWKASARPRWWARRGSWSMPPPCCIRSWARRCARRWGRGRR